MIAWLRRLFSRPPVKRRCPYGCDDRLVVDEQGNLHRSVRSIMFKGRCRIHDKEPKMTTPLEREILTHYWCYPGQFPKASSFIRALHTKFVRQGFLIHDLTNDEYRGNREALEIYMEALAAVPLPVRTWSMPA